MTVFCGWKSQPASLNFLEMRTTWSTPGSSSNISSSVGGSGRPTTPTMVRSSPSIRCGLRPSSRTRATTPSSFSRSASGFMTMIIFEWLLVAVICVYSVGQRGAFVQRCQLAMAARPSLYDRTGNRDVGDFIFVRCGGLAGDAGDLLVGDAPFGPELLRALEVGGAGLRGALRRVYVDEAADGLREGAGDGHLVRADPRDLGPPKRAGCRGRKDRGELRGGGKDGAGDVLGVQVVQPDQDLDQLLGRLEDVFG